MSTKSRRRAARRHPADANVNAPQALGAAGDAILSLVTLGTIDASAPSARDPMSSRQSEAIPASRH